MPTTEVTQVTPPPPPMQAAPIRVHQTTGRGTTVLVAIGASALSALLTVAVLQSSILPPSVQARLGIRVEVPSIVGMTMEQSRSVLDRLGLIPVVGTEKADATVAPGAILAQQPLPGWHLPRGSEVKLTISQGEKLPKVPDVAALPGLQASERLAAAKLKVGGSIEVASSTVPKGLTIGTVPAVSERVASDGLVQLLVSSGPPVTEAAVPKLTGLGRTRAIAALEQAGFKVGTVQWVSSDDLDAGIVVKQDPAAETQAPPGSIITLSVVRDE